jgi:hypothetical protein
LGKKESTAGSDVFPSQGPLLSSYFIGLFQFLTLFFFSYSRPLYIGAESSPPSAPAMAPRIKDGDAVVTVSHHAMRTSVTS